ncbi:MAG TPA: GTPase ObgE [Candidatus Saccharimonadia bacterium]|nr:GTPase ObgE [Candidatus Saccharimonadia bacterium]
MFTDVATIEIKAGKGGDGRLSFRHEKYRAKGGADGGNGGRGGNIIFRVDHNANTLASYRTVRLVAADDGQVGGENRRNGRQGADVTIKLPPGTQVWEGETLLADLTQDGQEVVMARGGRGGFGNAHFVSSVRQTPRTAELGEPGEARKLRLELKLVADVGLVGLPNAGKSTLLSVISNAKPEIADYAFTTLVPNLGVVDHRGYGFMVADIPGLIEGASAGKGLGDEFLRHIERTAVIVHLIDAGSDDVARDYGIIQAELAQYAVDLSARPQVVAISKVETVAPGQAEAAVAAVRAAGARDVFAISAQAHRGLEPLLDRLAAVVKADREARAAAQAEAAIPVIEATDLPDLWRVEAEGDGVYRVTGERIEGFARRTDFNQDEGVERLRDIMRKQGIARELRRQGARDGDTVRIGDTELAWLG